MEESVGTFWGKFDLSYTLNGKYDLYRRKLVCAEHDEFHVMKMEI